MAAIYGPCYICADTVISLAIFVPWWKCVANALKKPLLIVSYSVPSYLSSLP